jgi:hypothetical protein
MTRDEDRDALGRNVERPSVFRCGPPDTECESLLHKDSMDEVRVQLSEVPPNVPSEPTTRAIPLGLERALRVEIPVRGSEPVCYEIPLFVAQPHIGEPSPHGLSEPYNRSFSAPEEQAMWQRSPTGDSESTTCEVPVGRGTSPST